MVKVEMSPSAFVYLWYAGKLRRNKPGVQRVNHDDYQSRWPQLDEGGHCILYTAEIVGEIVNIMREYENPLVKAFHIQKKKKEYIYRGKLLTGTVRRKRSFVCVCVCS